MNIRMKLMSLAFMGAFAAPALAASNAEIEEMQNQIKRMQVKLEALEDGREDSGFGGLKISGMMDPTYIYNQRREKAGFNFLNNLDAYDRSGIGQDSTYAYDNSYFGQLLVQIEKEMEGGTKWKLALVPHKSAGSSYNFGSIIHEATVSIPLQDDATRLIAGQYADWSGYEYYFGHQNKLVTHNLLFDFAAPSFYQGAGIETTIGNLTLKAMLANMNKASNRDKNGYPVLTYRGDYGLGEFSGFGFAGQHGKVFGNRLNMFELDAYTALGDLSLSGQVGGGHWKNSAFNGKDATWASASVYVGYKVTPRFELIARGDYIKNDKNGGGTIGTVFGCVDAVGKADPDCVSGAANSAGDYRNGFGISSADALEYAAGNIADSDLKGANRSALSMGANYVLNTNTSLKFEYRIDHSSKETFFDVKTKTYEKTNTLVGASVVVSF